MRIHDNDPESSEPALFVCAGCEHPNEAPENAPPSYCAGCGAHIGLHHVALDHVEGESEEEYIVRAQEMIRSGEAHDQARRRTSH